MSERMNHQAVLMDANGEWTMRESPIPKPGVGQVLVKILSASICNKTDLHTYEGVHPPHDHQHQGMVPYDMRQYMGVKPDDPLAPHYPSYRYLDHHKPFPTLMGHEGMGVIVEMGPPAPQLVALGEEQPAPAFKVGDRVGIFPLLGGLGEYVLAEANGLIKVPDHVSNDHAGLFEPINVMFNATRKSCFLGEDVCILGAGALGLIGVQLAKLRGVDRIIVSEPVEWKRNLALKFGATHVIDPTTQNVVHEVEKITDGAVCDGVLECAGTPETIAMLPYLCKRMGLIVQVGAGGRPAYTDWDLIHFKFLRVEGMHYPMSPGMGGALPAMEKTMKLIATGRLDIDSLITHRYPFSVENVRKAFDEIRQDKVIKCVFSFDE